MTRIHIRDLQNGRLAGRRTAQAPVSSAPPSQRVVSLDAMRGFVMFWIVGGRELAMAVAGLFSVGAAEWVADQLSHPDWEGFTAWDTIMPAFLFIVGAAMPFAMAKKLEAGGSLSAVYWRIAKRCALLWVLGMVAQRSLLYWDLWQLELYSNTLQAIAVGYAVTALALLHLPPAGQIALCVGLTIAYAAAIAWIPFGNYPAGTLQQTANLPRYIDERLLGIFRRDHDFTWILTSIAFPATVLLGSLGGQLLRGRLPAGRKLQALIGLGASLMAVGWVWSYWQPLNRHLWTSSMIAWTGGLSFLTLAAFYAVIDVAGYRRWSFPFVVIGANALLAYLFAQVFDTALAEILFGNLAKRLPEAGGDLVIATATFGLLWLGLWYLYRNRTFLRV